MVVTAMLAAKRRSSEMNVQRIVRKSTGKSLICCALKILDDMTG